ncbi:MAG: hypothetical protein DRO99_03445 [Candidatus Aenigmatarchaeota archaeon]|nr:MAG: hypothetical protein DRO99_03445 [Candidatus Aenigmarchaeota archaeon]
MPYDLCVCVPPKEAAHAVKLAGEIGWDGLCLLSEKKDHNAMNKAVKGTAMDVSLGLLLEPKDRNDLGKKISSERKGFEVIAVKSADPEICRVASENSKVDILAGWEAAERNPVNYITAKAAAESGVSIAFSLGSLIRAYDRSRAGIMSKLLDTAKLVRKYGSPLVLTSGAVSFWGLRSPSEIMAFGSMLGFNGVQAKKGLSPELLEKNRERLSDGWVMPGVKKK